MPRIFDGMWCSEPGIGGAKLTAAGADFDVEWVTFDDGVQSPAKHAKWRNLCIDPGLEMQRLELGLMVSEVLQAHGQKVMDALGHPIDAYKEAQPYRDAAAEWKHWAVVRAGFMLGL